MRGASRVILVIGLVLLLAAPTAQAATVGGQLSFAADTHFLGALDVSTTRGALDLAAAVTAGEPVSLHWERAVGYERVYPWTTLVGPNGNAFRVGETIERKDLRWGPGSLGDLTCGDPCVVLVLAEDEGRVGLRGESAGPLRWTTGTERIFAGMDGTDPDAGFVYTIAPGWVRASGAAATAPSTLLSDAIAHGEGRLTLVLFNATATRSSAQGEDLVDTRTRVEPVGGLATPARVDRTTQRYVLLELEGASVEAPATRSATLVAPAADVALEGSLEAPSASGVLTIDGRERRLAREPLRLDGALQLATTIELLRAGVSPNTEPALSSGPRAAIAGSSSYAVVDGAAVLDEAYERAAVLAGAGALVGILVVVHALLSKGLLQPLYSRIRTSDVLRSEPRARLHAIVTDRPGLRASELGRAADMIRVVLDHHLRVLRAHGFVVERQKRFYAAGAAPAADKAASLVALEDGTRRAVAREVAAGPLGATQKELAAKLDLSVRLVSHHLRRLESQGLVAREGPRPSRFVARAGLRELLRDGPGNMKASEMR